LSSAGKTGGKRIADTETTATGGLRGLVEIGGGRLLGMAADRSLAISDDGGVRWKRSWKVRDRRGAVLSKRAGWGVAGLVRLKSGDLALSYEMPPPKGVGYIGGENRGGVFVRTSHDDGKTWSKEYRVTPPEIQAGPYHDSMIQLSSGRLIQPVRACFVGSSPASAKRPAIGSDGAYGKVMGRWVKLESHAHIPELDVTFVCYSDDEGRTWSNCDGVVMIWRKDGAIFPTDEPVAAELPNGNVLMFMRTTVGQIYQSVSADGGHTWSLPEPAGLASSYSPSRLRRIPGTGDLVCVWNQVSAAETRAGGRRSRLSSAISTNGGETWKNFKTIDAAGLPPAGRVAPPKEAVIVRARSKIKKLPKGWGIVHYPNLSFGAGRAFIMYSRGFHKMVDGKVRMVQEGVLRTVPTEWFYSK